jgi:hypothetical protein
MVRKLILSSLAGLKVMLSVLPVSLGAAILPTSSSAATTESRDWTEVSANPTAVGLSNFILTHPESRWTDDAFCALFEIDGEAAAQTVSNLLVSYPNGEVDLSTCVEGVGSSGIATARLVNI